MHARLTSLLRFRSMLPIIWMACAIWVGWSMHDRGHSAVAFSMVGGTAVYIPIFRFVVVSTRRKHGSLRRGIAYVTAVVAGMITAVYPMAAFAIGYPDKTLEWAYSVSVGGLFLLFSVGIWFSPLLKRKEALLSESLAMWSWNMARVDGYFSFSEMVDDRWESDEMRARAAHNWLAGFWFAVWVSTSAIAVILLATATTAPSFSHFMLGLAVVLVSSLFRAKNCIKAAVEDVYRIRPVMS